MSSEQGYRPLRTQGSDEHKAECMALFLAHLQAVLAAVVSQPWWPTNLSRNCCENQGLFSNEATQHLEKSGKRLDARSLHQVLNISSKSTSDIGNKFSVLPANAMKQIANHDLQENSLWGVQNLLSKTYLKKPKCFDPVLDLAEGLCTQKYHQTKLAGT